MVCPIRSASLRAGTITATRGAEANPRLGAAAGAIRQNFPRAPIRYSHVRQQSAAIANVIIAWYGTVCESAFSRPQCRLRTSLLATQRDHRINLHGASGRQVAGQ